MSPKNQRAETVQHSFNVHQFGVLKNFPEDAMESKIWMLYI